MLTPGSRLRGAIFAVAGLFFTDARLAFAQAEGLQEVVVTAERRAENLQTIPIAVTALSSEFLTKEHAENFAAVGDLSTSINFTPYPSSSNMLILYMRGQGVADANQITQDGSVGLYEDGFYISRPQGQTFDLADPERVEILRGPQGTLYGRNTTGGAVNIVSKKPTGEWDFAFSLDGGSRSYVRALATLNLPKIFGGLSTKFTLLYSNINGNVTNSGGEDYNKEWQKGARALLRWDNGGIFTMDYFFEWGEIDSTPIYYQDAALYPAIKGYPPTTELADNTWEPIFLPSSVAHFNADGLTLAFKLGDSATLKSLTYYRGLNTNFYQDYAGAFTNPATAPFIGITNFSGYDWITSNEFTQELQLLGDIGKNFNYQVGLYYFDESALHLENGNINLPLFAPGPPLFFPFTQTSSRYVTADAKSKAAYAQVTWKISEPWSLTAGGRYTKDDRSATRMYTINQTITALVPPFGPVPVPLPPQSDPPGSANNLSFSKFNPMGAINWAINPDLNTYLRIATGYKAGGSSEAGPIGSFGQTFAPENVTTYELGLKSTLFEHKMRANIAVFYSDFSDMQLQFNVNPANLAIVQSYNAGKASVTGAELELLWAPVPDFTFGLNDTLLSTDFKTVTAEPNTVFDPATNPASPYKVGQNINFLFRLPYAPNNIVSTNIDWTMFHAQGGNLELFLNYRYQGRQYDTSPTGLLVPGSATYYSIDSYGVLDGRLTWNFHLADSKKTMRFSIWAKNMTNEKYPLHVIGQGAAPIVPLQTAAGPIPQTGYTYQAVAWAARPIYGAQFQYGF